MALRANGNRQVRHVPAGREYLGRPTHVEGEVLAALHLGRRLDHEQRVVVDGACGAQERAHTDEAVNHTKAQALRVEGFSARGVGNEVHNVRQRARRRLRGRAGRDRHGGVDSPVQIARGVDTLGRKTDRPALRHLEAEHEAQVVDAFQ